ncbi:hypothetical protein PLICRDRAFT_161449 [Plicaturopsis crispa FD-325 SS-3]|nr:hypothetical protein PLICRDRAFT_161449 [Plicaturopsis crispa FD-325 SS-3]
MSQFGDNNYYGGGGGGGFLAGGSPMGSAGGSPGGARRSEASHSLRPLTCRQVVNATQAHADADWHVDDAEIGQITVVGSVVTVNRQATNCVYWVDDGTARIEVRHWAGASDEDNDKGDAIGEGVFVRVTGALKTFGQKRYVNATQVRLSPNPSELYFHFLDAMTVTRIREKGPPAGPGAANGTGSGANGSTSASAYAVQSASTNDQYSHLPAVQRQIIQFIASQAQNDDGVHVAAIARAIGGDAHSISEALDKLADEGLVFTTIDESHYSLAQ